MPGIRLSPVFIGLLPMASKPIVQASMDTQRRYPARDGEVMRQVDDPVVIHPLSGSGYAGR